MRQHDGRRDPHVCVRTHGSDVSLKVEPVPAFRADPPRLALQKERAGSTIFSATMGGVAGQLCAADPPRPSNVASRIPCCSPVALASEDAADGGRRDGGGGHAGSDAWRQCIGTCSGDRRGPAATRRCRRRAACQTWRRGSRRARSAPPLIDCGVVRVGARDQGAKSATFRGPFLGFCVMMTMICTEHSLPQSRVMSSIGSLRRHTCRADHGPMAPGGRMRLTVALPTQCRRTERRGKRSRIRHRSSSQRCMPSCTSLARSTRAPCHAQPLWLSVGSAVADASASHGSAEWAILEKKTGMSTHVYRAGLSCLSWAPYCAGTDADTDREIRDTQRQKQAEIGRGRQRAKRRDVQTDTGKHTEVVFTSSLATKSAGEPQAF